jgi:hypothetical protein
MENDGSLESTANQIVGLLNSSGVANDQLDKIGETSDVQNSEQQVAEAEPELINTEQPNDSDLAVIDESLADSEQLSDAEQTEPTQETSEQEPEPTYYQVKVQGQEYDVSLDELKAGYSRDNDYRIKTETLAIERNQFKEEQSKQQEVLSQKLAQLDQMQNFAKQQLQIDAQGLDELMQSDPVEGMRKRHELETRARQIHQQNAYIEQQKTDEHSKFIQDEQKKMYLSIPELKNPETRDGFNKNLVNYLQELDFSQDEISQVNDHRYVKLIADGMKYRALQKRKPQLKQKVAGATPVLKGGVVTSKETKNARAKTDKMTKFKKTGSIEDATDILKGLFE